MLPNSILKQGLVPKQKEEPSTKKQKGTGIYIHVDICKI